MDGHPLTAAELKFLSLTSTSLDQFINKKLYQGIIDVIDPELISRVSISWDV